MRRSVELWGGVECTVNRVRDEYIEQLRRSGHENRISDLDLFAELGIRALRQPVLWERVAPEGLATADWSWTDRWLARLRELNIAPIAGLVHHGSGPRTTSLLDPEFPEKLAQYARAVAERYPWVEMYTPVNEILTTARFSALYGLWYPHAQQDASFVTALLNECRATVLAMQEIRRVNPAAKLVQTDDLGKIFSTPRLLYQADFENERRWLAWDLVAGRVDRSHPMWGYLLHNGASLEVLEFLAENGCSADIIGVNHYLSSERYLDENTERYPGETVGGNGIERYVDVLAARVRCEGVAGPLQLLCETWERYHIPIAITEVHNGCTREEHLRWLVDVWRAAETARDAGIDVRAVTLWSLLGAFDWNTLVTRNDDHYEPGVFDIRAPLPRATAIAHIAKDLGTGRTPEHPLLDEPGWWKRQERLVYGHAVTDGGEAVPARGPHLVIAKSTENTRPLLITGARGTLGRAIARACVVRGIAHRVLTRDEMDIGDRDSVERAMAVLQPWAVINAAGYVRVDDAETDVERCMRENADGPAYLAAAARDMGAQFVTYSSDLVFDGAKSHAYVESDRVNPLNVYGESKALAEQRVLEILPSALVVRTSAFFGPWDDYNFIAVALREIAATRVYRAAADATVSPTYVPDLVNATLDLMIDGESGIWHVANSGQVTWAELAKRAAEQVGVPTGLVEPCLTNELNMPAARPLFSVLGSERSTIMPTLESALRRFFEATADRWEEPLADAA